MFEMHTQLDTEQINLKTTLKEKQLNSINLNLYLWNDHFVLKIFSGMSKYKEEPLWWEVFKYWHIINFEVSIIIFLLILTC